MAAAHPDALGTLFSPAAGDLEHSPTQSALKRPEDQLMLENNIFSKLGWAEVLWFGTEAIN